MRKLRAVLVLMAVLVIGSFSLIYAGTPEWHVLPVDPEKNAAEPGARCECQYTSGAYGVLCPSEGCCVVDCWNKLPDS